MSITPFSVILIVIIGYIILERRKLKIRNVVYKLFFLKLFLELVLDYGYFIKIGQYTLSYNGFVSIILFIFCLPCIKKNDKRVLGSGLIFFIIAVIGLISEILFPYNYPVVGVLNGWDRLLQGNYTMQMIDVGFGNFGFLFTLIRYVLIMSVIKTELNDRESVFDFVRHILSISTLSIVYGYLELVLKNVFKFDVADKILSPIFGVTDSSYASLYQRGSFYMLQGLCKEASYYSNTLFVFSLLCIAYIYYVSSSNFSSGKRLIRREKIRLIALVGLLVFSFSFSTMLYLVFIAVAYIIVAMGQRKAVFIIEKIIYVLPVVMILLVVFMMLPIDIIIEYYNSRVLQLTKTIQQILETGAVHIFNTSSEAARLTSILQSLNHSIHRPLFGLGIGTTDCHSLIASLLSNCGILGFIFWNKTVMAFSKTQMTNRKFIICLYAILCVFGSFGDVFALYYPIVILVYNYLYVEARESDKVNNYFTNRTEEI